jgi:hypothetical protein
VNVDEFKGYCLLEACRLADVSKVKKLLSSDIAKFKHHLTGDTAFVSYDNNLFYILCIICTIYLYFFSIL